MTAATAQYPLTYLPNLEGAAVSALLGQDLNKRVIVALTEAVGATCQTVEDAAFDFATGMPFSVATGAALDWWGALVGQPRLGLVDADYRRVIAARILVNRCDGSVDAISKIVQTIIGVGRAWTVTPGPGIYYVCFVTPTEAIPQIRRAIKRDMIAVTPAGTEMHLCEWADGGLVLTDEPAGTTMLSGTAGMLPLPSGLESRIDFGTLGRDL